MLEGKKCCFNCEHWVGAELSEGKWEGSCFHESKKGSTAVLVHNSACNMFSKGEENGIL